VFAFHFVRVQRPQLGFKTFFPQPILVSNTLKVGFFSSFLTHTQKSVFNSSMNAGVPFNPNYSRLGPQIASYRFFFRPDSSVCPATGFLVKPHGNKIFSVNDSAAGLLDLHCHGALAVKANNERPFGDSALPQAHWHLGA